MSNLMGIQLLYRLRLVLVLKLHLYGIFCRSIPCSYTSVPSLYTSLAPVPSVARRSCFNVLPSLTKYSIRSPSIKIILSCVNNGLAGLGPTYPILYFYCFIPRYKSFTSNTSSAPFGSLIMCSVQHILGLSPTKLLYKDMLGKMYNINCVIF